MCGEELGNLFVELVDGLVELLDLFGQRQGEQCVRLDDGGIGGERQGRANGVDDLVRFPSLRTPCCCRKVRSVLG